MTWLFCFCLLVGALGVPQWDHSCTQHPGGPEHGFILTFVYRGLKTTFTSGCPGRLLHAERKPSLWAAGGPPNPQAQAKGRACWSAGEVSSHRPLAKPQPWFSEDTPETQLLVFHAPHAHRSMAYCPLGLYNYPSFSITCFKRGKTLGGQEDLCITQLAVARKSVKPQASQCHVSHFL